MKKVEYWLSIAERIIGLIRPKFYNAITRIVVLFGLALSVESQINIFEAFAVASFEKLFGPSDFLRQLFSGSTSPWIGVFFVVFGLIYNGIVTVGLELIQKYKAQIPKVPEFSFSFLNADGEEIEQNSCLRGKLCHIDVGDIPDNSTYSDFATQRMNKEGRFHQFGHLSGTSSPVKGRIIGPYDARVNRDFYRDRAKFLRVWGGAEILTLYLINKSNVLASNVRVEISCQRDKGLSLDNKNDLSPEFPKQETESSLSQLSALPLHNTPPHFDVKSKHNNSRYFYEWNVGNLQAQEECSSHTNIFIRTDTIVDISIRIFCDELPSPMEMHYKIMPTEKSINVGLDHLKANGKEFFSYANSAIMDGYLKRHSDRLLKEYKNKEDELVP